MFNIKKLSFFCIDKLIIQMYQYNGKKEPDNRNT